MRTLLVTAYFLMTGTLLVSQPSHAPASTTVQTARPSAQRAVASDEKKKEEYRKEAIRLKALHQGIVSSIKTGKSLNETVPPEALKSLTANAGFHPAAYSDFHEYAMSTAQDHNRLTYRDLLQADEDRMVAMNVDKVAVEIDAQPQSCEVDVMEVASGKKQSFGQTKAKKSLDPKWYVFTCKCLGKPLSSSLDCTSDQSYTFQCGKAEKR